MKLGKPLCRRFNTSFRVWTAWCSKTIKHVNNRTLPLYSTKRSISNDLIRKLNEAAVKLARVVAQQEEEEISSNTTSGSSSLELSGNELVAAIIASKVEKEVEQEVTKEEQMIPRGNLAAVDPILVVSSDDKAFADPELPQIS
ncbi:hypothetical protein Acr_00g0061060 [Actinidia rufa]|uniref:Uncharacterized protein n=1 Tax=Actinidia rufa TaxID=165716 RepID=A0A7J0DNT5_9ERIC|nr:hypothetical protein Acr_00g0061060 [Actinidia rufa]